jgi:peroxiredoxin
MPSLVKLYNEFKDTGFVVLAIDIAEKKGIVEAYAKKEKLPFPILLDTDGKVANSYWIRAHPAHFLIDGQGVMIGKKMGANAWANDQSRNLIRVLLEENNKKANSK